MSLSIFKLFFLSLLLVACGTLPPKPIVTLCVVDYPRSQAICGETGGEAVTSTRQLSYRTLVQTVKASATVRRVPLSQLDKSVAFTPVNWEKLKNYLDQLEAAAKERCR